MEENENIIELNGDDGSVVQFEFLDLIEYSGEEYVVLLPVEDEDGEVVILRLEGEDEETESYVSVDDPEILEAVFGIFREKFRDEFDFE